jgi:hypothetical protein
VSDISSHLLLCRLRCEIDEYADRIHGLDPFDIVRSIERLIRSVWDMGFNALKLAMALFPARFRDRDPNLARDAHRQSVTRETTAVPKQTFK